MYRPHFTATEDVDLKLAVFCTGPGIRDTASNLISEIIGTFVLVFAVLFLAVSVFGLGALDALPVGLLVLAIGLSLGGTFTGYAINPARDLGPRIMHAILAHRRRQARQRLGVCVDSSWSARSSARCWPVCCIWFCKTPATFISVDRPRQRERGASAPVFPATAANASSTRAQPCRSHPNSTITATATGGRC